MRKHPLLALLTACLTCSIPGALTAAGATTTSSTSPTTHKVDPVAPTTDRVATRATHSPHPSRRPRVRTRLRSRGRVLSSSVHPYVALGGVWHALRSCESNDNYAENTGNGFFGAYQFTFATWHALGEPGLPSSASPQVQDAAARALFLRQGWRAWPACAWRIGVV
jgi:hypothetical protein